MEELSSVVRAAQRGDPDAFGELVRRYQDMAYTAAYVLVGDYHLAEDAAQEAFLQAYFDLSTLREPAAFPGWFRRIVFKHSNRLIRGKRVALLSLDDTIPVPSADSEPSTIAERHELRDLVRAQIGRLPEHERLAVTLFYFMGHSQHEIAAFLEVPVTTVKKRLYAARQRLLDRMLDPVRDTLHEHRPSQDDRFARKVQFLIAVSTGDVGRTEWLLQQDPALARVALTKEDWRNAEAGQQQSLPMRWGYTALHLAATYGYQPLVEVLLTYNADVNANTCGETPLHRAIMVNDSDMVALLLRSGADVNASDLQGVTPLERAVIKGQHHIVQVLLAYGAEIDAHDQAGRTPLHWAALKGNRGLIVRLLQDGADPEVRDTTGQTPLDWATRNGHTAVVDLLHRHGGITPTVFADQGHPPHDGAEGERLQPAVRARRGVPDARNGAGIDTRVIGSEEVATVPVGERVLGRVLNARGEPIDGLERLDDAPRAPLSRPVRTSHSQRISSQMLKMGIKAIDLFAPLVRGGTVQLSGPTGVGVMIMLGEWTRRIATRGDGCMVYVGWESQPLQVNEVIREWREQGIDDRIAMVIGHTNEPRAQRQQTLLVGLTIAEHARNQGQDVLLAVDTSLLSTRDLRGVLGGIPSGADTGAITLVLLDIWWNGTPTNRSGTPELDSRLVFDGRRARQGLYPAVDPLLSNSRLLEAYLLSDRHVQVAHQACAVLQRYQDLQEVVDQQGMESLSREDQQLVIRARRLQRFLTQPFFVTEAWTGIPAEYIPIEETIKGVTELLEGCYDEVPEETFLYAGTIDQMFDQAKRLEQQQCVQGRSA